MSSLTLHVHAGGDARAATSVARFLSPALFAAPACAACGTAKEPWLCLTRLGMTCHIGIGFIDNSE